MKIPFILCCLLFPAGFLRLTGAEPKIVLASGQGHPAVVDWVAGTWDQGGRILLEGAYVPNPPSVPQPRKMVWRGQVDGTFAELVGDGDAVPYFSMPVGGTAPKLWVPRLQGVFNGYDVPRRFRAFYSSIWPTAPYYESQVLWVQDLERPSGASPTAFLVNDLESHTDGAVVFRRPVLRNVVVRQRSATAALEEGSFVALEGGGGLQFYVNSQLTSPDGLRTGNLVWQSRHDLSPVASGPSNLVRVLAASAGLQLALPGSSYLTLDVLGVDPQERLLWQAAKAEGTHVLRGEAGAWTTLVSPGAAAPPARGVAPAPATPLGQVGTVGLVAGGSAFFAEAKYAATAGDLAGRAALLLHANDTVKLLALEGETLNGADPGARLGKFTPTGYSWPDANSVAFYGQVRGTGDNPFMVNQGLLLADETGVWLLAREGQQLPVPAGGAYLSTFRFAILTARPDRKVVFGAIMDLGDGAPHELLYAVTPGHPNHYEVLLESGTTVTVPTFAGNTQGTIRSFNTIQWKPASFDQLLLNVDLLFATPPTKSAVLVLETGRVAGLRAELRTEGLRLGWPAALGAVLEAATSLGAAWEDSRLTVVRVGDEFQAEVPLAADARFFRVRP